MGQGSLDVTRILDGVRVVVLGGTGFLGKLFWSMLIDRYPNVGRVYVVVRPKNALSPDARFWTEIAASETLEPLRRTHGDNFESFLRSKVVAVDGDMGRPMCGLDEPLVRQLRGTTSTRRWTTRSKPTPLVRGTSPCLHVRSGTRPYCTRAPVMSRAPAKGRFSRKTRVGSRFRDPTSWGPTFGIPTAKSPSASSLLLRPNSAPTTRFVKANLRNGREPI